MTDTSAPPAPSEAVPARRSARQRRRHGNHVLLAAIYVAFCALYLWTETSGKVDVAVAGSHGGYYNQLADGFLHGELSIPTPAPHGLLALPNPYSPAQNGPWQGMFHDLALYHGHFFLTWGPTPVVTLFLPWRILQLGNVTQGFAVWLYSVVGLLFAVLLLCFLVRTYLPRTRFWQVVLGEIALATGSVEMFMLRRPLVYEVAIACAYCFSMAGLYLLATGGLGGRKRPWRLGAGSVCLGLAAGAHWDLVLFGLAILLLLVHLARRDGVTAWGERSRLAAIVVGPFALIVVLLLAYNLARFGSPLQFGASYQLAGYDPTKTPFYQLGYLAPSLYYYLVAPVRWSLGFPYFFLPPPPDYPGHVLATYAPDIVGGILTTTPILLVLLALPWLWRRRLPRELAAVVAVLVGTAALLVLAIAFSLPGASMRYEADFGTLLLLPALLVWMALSTGRPVARRLLKVLGALLVVYGAIVGVAISITGYYDELRTASPGTFWTLERLTSAFPTVMTMLLGHPVLTRVNSPNGAGTAPSYGSLGAGQVLFFYISPQPTDVQIVSPRSMTARLDLIIGPGSDPAAAGPSDRVVVYDNGRTQVLRYVPGPYRITIELRSGVNRIGLAVRTPNPTMASNTRVLAGQFMTLSTVASPSR